MPRSYRVLLSLPVYLLSLLVLLAGVLLSVLAALVEGDSTP